MHNIKRLAFIGGGNMAAALIGGLTKRGLPSDADRRRRSERANSSRGSIRDFGIRARPTTPARRPTPRS